jgi:hypothetical protein
MEWNQSWHPQLLCRYVMAAAEQLRGEVAECDLLFPCDTKEQSPRLQSLQGVS